MNPYLLEACVDSVESAQAAANGGADRLELCANLIIGGTTPGVSLFKQIRKLCHIPIHVLLRPRYGDFLYTDNEFEMIKEDASMFISMGADGIVTGFLTPEGNLDLERMKALREIAGKKHFTLHRAFDLCRDPFRTMEEAISLGVNTILTSGRKNTCLEGKELLGQLIKQAGERISILVGSGVTLEAISCLVNEIHASHFHMSGKITLDSKMVYRKKDVYMGINGMSEYEIFRTDEEQIRQAIECLKALCHGNP